MMILIAAAALAAQPATPAPAAPQTQHDMHMEMGKDADHKGMDCCKGCSKDKAAMHDGHGPERGQHSAHN
jgi:hypothetical protein